jgi:hypothetical protein
MIAPPACRENLRDGRCTRWPSNASSESVRGQRALTACVREFKVERRATIVSIESMHVTDLRLITAAQLEQGVVADVIVAGALVEPRRRPRAAACGGHPRRAGRQWASHGHRFLGS